LIPWAKSAVLFSFRQAAPFRSDTGDFRVAAYALGEDYHHRARRILNAAEKHLREIAEADGGPPPRFAGFCDTWPVFERDLAAEAGLGWRGKNACLIHRRHGSGFLLAGFFTDLTLESPAIPREDLCGGCTACLDHCPTGALFEPGRLDASKCLGYWTIEAKGDIPVEISEKSGTWIFGCDICQDACPWNRKPQKTAAPEFPAGRPRTAREWLSLLRKGGGFASRFKNTPLLRAGRRALLRNVLIALRHLKAEDVNDLLNSLASEEDDPVVRAELHKTMCP
jgi:epoxyqueuosine reductase